MSVETSSREFDFGPEGRKWVWLGSFAAVLAILTTLLLLDIGESEAAVAPPGIPTAFTATPIADGVRLTWGEPVAPGEPEFNHYRVTSSTRFGTFICEVERSVRTCDAALGGTPETTLHSFSVVALFRAPGASGETIGMPAKVQGTPGRVPSAPQNLEAAPVDGGVQLTWAMPNDLGVPNEVTYRVDDPSRPNAAPYCEGIIETECRVSKEDAKTKGFRVVAVNAAGKSQHVYVESLSGALPSKVQNVWARPRVGSAIVRWEAPEILGNPPVRNYLVRASNGERQFCAVKAADELRCEIAEIDGTTNVEIVPLSKLGDGEANSFDVTAGMLPSAPLNVMAVTKDGGVTITWDEPENLGFPELTEYVIRDEVGAQPCENNETTCTIGGLDNGTERTFTVFARNDLDIGPGAKITFTPNKPVDPSVMDITVAKPGVQELTIEGKDFPAGRQHFAVACLNAATPADANLDTCDVRALWPVIPDKDGNLTVEVTFDVLATGLVFSIADSESTAVAAGMINVEAPTDYNIVVRAKGERAEETFSVTIGGTEIGTGTATHDYQDYTFTAPADSVGGVSVNFTNDFYDGNIDRNLWIDYVKINGKTYESESESTYTQGAWTAGAGCSPGFRRSERIVCGGTFTYTVLKGDGGEWTPKDPYLPEEPAPEEAASKHVIRVRAKGDTGGESFALRIGTDVIGHVAVTNEWRTYRFKLDTLPSGKLALAFMNDSDDGYNDFNLQVDFVKVDDQKYETEDARIYMAGPGPDAACTSGYKQAETLYCAGAFFYADL